MDYKGFELRYNVQWLVNGMTHRAPVGVFKEGRMVAPCENDRIAKAWIDQHTVVEVPTHNKRKKKQIYYDKRGNIE